MANYNRAQLIGRLAEDPRVTTGRSGQTMASLIVVVNEFFRTGDGQQGKSTSSFKVRLYGQPASYAAGYLWAGSLVMVAGKLRNERWTDKESGEVRYSVVIVVDDPEGLQGLAKPGHKATDDDEGDESASSGDRQGTGDGDMPEMAPEETTPNAGSPEFEEAHGLQPIPF